MSDTPTTMAELRERYNIVTSVDNLTLVERAEILVLSVKPQIMRRVLDQISDRVRPDALVVSGRRSCAPVEGAQYHRAEIRHGPFRFDLPQEVPAE